VYVYLHFGKCDVAVKVKVQALKTRDLDNMDIDHVGIQITASSLVKSPDSDFVVYHIHISGLEHPYVVFRRFNEFKELQSNLYSYTYMCKARDRPRNMADMQVFKID